VKPMLWLRRQCAGKGAQAHTVDYRSLMPWDDDAVTDANAGIVKCYVQVPVGLLPHRILQFIHEQAVDHVMTKKFVICRIPHGIPPGAYVSVVFATEDFKHPDVHIVRASVPRVVRPEAKAKMEHATSSGKGHYMEVTQLDGATGQLRRHPTTVFRQQDSTKGHEIKGTKAKNVIGLIVAVAGRPDEEGNCPAKRENAIDDLVKSQARVPPRYGTIVAVPKVCPTTKKPLEGAFYDPADQLSNSDLWVKIQWVDSLDPVLQEDAEVVVQLSTLDLGTFVREQGELAIEYYFDNYGESSSEVMRVRMSLSSVDRGYLTKKTPAEYAASEDVVEELRMRFTDTERDRPPNTIDELLERSWPRNFTADDLHDHANQVDQRFNKNAEHQKQMRHDLNDLKVDMARLISRGNYREET